MYNIFIEYSRTCACTFQDDVEEEENHGDAFHKFRAIEKKAVKAIFSSKVWKDVDCVDCIWDFDDFQVLEHKIEAAEIAILAKSYIKRFESESENLFD